MGVRFVSDAQSTRVSWLSALGSCCLCNRDPLLRTAGATVAAERAPVRERIVMDTGWRFAIGHASDPEKDFGHGTGYFSYVAKTG